ncbi:MAG: hypothetical protein KIH01_00180 [Candidatus Freyarchaeota archaeon]|nr:hypothetical protein [Candidatus Jordarchaeia archaeon]
MILALLASPILNQPPQIYSLYPASPPSPPYTPAILTTNSVRYIIIVGDQSWIDAIRPFAEWKTLKGLPAEIYTTNSIYENYTGEDGASKIRNFLKDLYISKGARWVLLVGDVDKIPIRNFSVGNNIVPSDYYYAALDGSFDDDKDGRYGEPGEIDWIPELYVGRVPVSSIDELNVFINKTLTYEQHLLLRSGEWTGRVLLAGGEISYSQDIQGWRAKLAALQAFPLPPSGTVLLAYDSKRQFNNLTESSFIDAIENEGAAVVDICSHGSPTALYISQSGTSFFTSTAAGNLSNGYHLPLFFISACSAGYIDGESDSIAESLLKNPKGGAIAVIAPTRTSFGGDTLKDAADTFFDYTFFKIFFSADPPLTRRPGYALYEAKKEYYESYVHLVKSEAMYTQLFLEYILLGDPELPVYFGLPKILNVTVEGLLVPGQRITLKISDGRSPVSGAYVCIQGWNYYHTYLTDENGMVHLPCPERGLYNITVTKEGFFPTQTSIEVGTPIRILVDEFHQQEPLEFWNSTLLLRGTLNASLFHFQKLETQITPAILKEFDALIVYYPSGDYNDNELEAILDFVRSGGGLIIIGENDPSLAYNANKLASIFNINFLTCDPSGPVAARCIKAPQTFRANEVLLCNNGKIEGGTPILVVQGSIIVASCISWGNGRVAFISDLDLWKDELVAEKDNIQLFKSLCEWLVGDLAPVQFSMVIPLEVRKGEIFSLNVTADHPYDIINLMVVAISGQGTFTNISQKNTVSLQLDTLELENEVIIYAIAVTGNGKVYISDATLITITERKISLNLPLVISRQDTWRIPLSITVATMVFLVLALLYPVQKRSRTRNRLAAS